MPRTLLIVNPIAGSGRAKAANAAFTGSESLDIVVAKAKGDVVLAAGNAARQGYERVLVAGGDGTINEAVNGLAGSDVELGIIALGTANVLARELELPINDPQAAMNVIHTGKAHAIDLGLAGSRYFAAMAGMGFDAGVVHRVVPRVKSLIGVGAYGLAVAGELMNLKPAHFILNADGRTIETDAFVVLFANSASYAYGIKVASHASTDDGLIDVIIFEKAYPARLALLHQGLKVLLHSHMSDPNIRSLQAQKVSVRSQPEVMTQLDGDVMGKTPIDISIVPKALKVVVQGRGKRRS